MKKFMTIVLAAALMFAAAGQASASTLETSGEYRGRYWYLSNYNYAGNAADSVDGSQDFWDQRLRLGMTWKVTDTVKVGARADILENVWKTDGADNSEIDFDWAFAQFDLAPVVFTVGKQDVAWGLGAYAKADNRYRFKAGAKFDPVSLVFAWDTFTEVGDLKDAGDDNGYSFGITMPAAGWNFGLLGIARSQKQDPSFENSIYGVNVFGTGALGPAKIAFEAMYADGERDYDSSATKDIDGTGTLAYVGAFMPVGGLNLGLEFGYATGDETNKDGTPKGNNEGLIFHDYNGPFNSFILFNNFDLDGWNSVYSGGADKGLNNAMAVKLSGTYAATQKLSFMLAGIYAQADEKQARPDDDMGVEIDGLIKYAATENVTVQMGVAYLAAGDYFKVKNLAGTWEDPEDPVVVTAHAIVTF